MSLLRKARQVSEREIALALVLEYAKGKLNGFSLSNTDDLDFMVDLAIKLQVEGDAAFVNKLTRVVRRLVNYGVLDAHTCTGQKFYFGVTNRETRYTLRPGKAELLRSESIEGVTLGAEGEADFLLRRVYPQPDA